MIQWRKKRWTLDVLYSERDGIVLIMAHQTSIKLTYINGLLWIKKKKQLTRLKEPMPSLTPPSNCLNESDWPATS